MADIEENLINKPEENQHPIIKHISTLLKYYLDLKTYLTPRYKPM